MKADWDDAPIYIKKKPNDTLRIGIAFVAGCAVTAGALFLGSKSYTSIEPKPLVVTESTYQPRKSASPEAHAMAKVAAGEKKAQALAELLANTRERQAKGEVPSFHDGNYIPRGAVNVVPFENPRAELKSGEMRLVVVKQEPRPEDSCNHLYSPGSIELRECRMHIDLENRNNTYTGNRSR